MLHASTSEFRHDIGVVDMALLVARELDWDAVERRARAWGLATAVHVALRTLQAVGVELPRGTREMVERTRPRGWRGWALARGYDVGRWPVARGEMELGGRWIVRQVVWRNELVPWIVGVASYSGARLIEHLDQRRRAS